jgi:hypothetical protein
MSSNANDTARKRKNEGFELGFEGILNKKRAIAETVLCCVCYGIVVKAVSLVPCGHSLCQSCWIEAAERCRLPGNESVENMNSPTCSSCRQPVTSYVMAYAVNNIVAALVAVSPEVFEVDDVDAYHRANGSVPVVHDDVPIDNDHRYEATEAPEANVGRRRNDRGSGNTINATVLEAIGEGDGERNALNDTNRRNREAVDQIQTLRMLLRGIFESDNITFDEAFHALRENILEDSTIWDHVVAVAILPIVWLVTKKMTTAIMGLVVKEMICWNTK